MEITARDLRIGNYVNYRIQDDLDERKDWLECSVIDANDLVILESGIDCDYQPIPLTEEWLLKFWFVKNLFDDVFELGEFSVRVDELDCVFAWNRFNIDINLKNVHRLQNLYYIVTQTELTITK